MNIKDSSIRIKAFLDNHIINSLKTGKSQDFRWNRYWNEAWDNLYKFHLKLLQEIYDRHSGAFKKPGEESYMAPSEFESIWLRSNLLNDRFANRDILVCFNLAMQTRVDEVNSDKHLKMAFVEFLEAVARAADYLSFPPPTQIIKDMYKKMWKTKQEDVEEDKKEVGEVEEDVEMSEEELIHQPISKKIENILPYLLIHWTSQSFKK